jgi:DNA helicase II / ATP-dependent DNA helicase PcrA
MTRPTLSADEFIEAIEKILGQPLNAQQLECVKHPLPDALMIVAGPGSGKTTVLVLRALRHMLVDSMSPDSILITTFTRKAASEISSRLVGWGLRLIEHFKREAERVQDSPRVVWLESLDVNAIQAGTLDTFLQRWLGQTRQIGTPAPVMLEEFAANFVYRRRIFAPVYRNGASAHLDPYLAQYNYEQAAPRNQGEAGNLSISVNNRLIQDLVDVPAYAATGAAQRIQADLLKGYRSHLQAQQLFDFSLCAERVLGSLKAGQLYKQLPELHALLIDEYHDTNPMQEAIYFELVKQSGCALTIVGDDDQALYRFRGATVEVFTNFQKRFANQVSGAKSQMIYLVRNHRSTPEIVKFFNEFASHDRGFAAARVANKPPIVPFNQSRGVPVLGLFRDSIGDLAEDLTQLLVDVFQGGGRTIPSSVTGAVLRGSEHGGAIGDAVLLAASVREYRDDGSERLPALVRRKLVARNLGVFNPRGQDLRDLLNVQRLLGLVLLCLDPADQIENTLYITRDVRNYLPVWRDRARQFIAANPLPNSQRGSLKSYVDGWRMERASSGDWPDEIPLLDLLYKLIVWMPEFQNDPEHLVYLEAIMRCVVQGAHYSSYGFQILKATKHRAFSRNAVITDLLAPVAEKTVEINEDLLFAVPRNRLNIMTIHQSKGLEYPMVIVDVGSEFKTNHAKQAFRRFPRAPSVPVVMETDLAKFTEIGPFRTVRGDLDRTFDDIARLYYVAYSRPQVALVLVGLTKSIEYATTVQNIATCWARDGAWSWRQNNPPLKRGTPTRPERMPLTLL